MKKFMPIAQKNDRRGANWSMVEPGVEAGAHVFDAVGERVGELEVLRRARLLHVIAGDRDRVELRHAAPTVKAKMSEMMRIEAAGG